MASLSDPSVSELLTKPNHGVLATINRDGSPHSAVVWVNVEDGKIAVNSVKGRAWPTNVERDGRASLVVINQENPYEYVEIRGTAAETGEGADEHIDTLAQKYINQERYPWRQPGEQRVKFLITPDHVRYAKA